MRLPCPALPAAPSRAGEPARRPLRMPLLLALSLTTTLLGLLPGSAAGQEPIPLAGEVRLTSSATGKVPVVVPADASVDLGRGLRIEGDGRFTGIVLTEPGTAGGFVLRALRSPAQGGTRPLDAEVQLAAAQRTDGTVTCTGTCPVPAGRYDLYVVADGTPVRVELDLGGLPGEVAIDDATLAAVPTAQSDGVPHSFSTFAPWGSSSTSGQHLPMPAGGMAFGQAIATVSTRTVATGWADVCLYVDTVSCRPMARAHLTATALAPATARLVGFLEVPPGFASSSGGVWFACVADFTLRYDLDVLLIGW